MKRTYSKSALHMACLAAAMNNEEWPDKAALNFEFKPPAHVPDWIELIPAGPEITGRDGRKWRLDDPQALVEAFHTDTKDLPVDIEHATELKAPEGDSAPAVGWIKALEIRDGSVWGRVEWNNDGGFAVGERQYRYISPVFLFDKTTMQIVRLTSAALTNQPNLALQALNREGESGHEEETMDLKQLLAALKLPETTTFAEALNHIHKMKGDLATAQNRAENPSLDKFVPRADHDAAVNRADKAEQDLKELKEATLEDEIKTEITAALEAGKITPGTKDYYTAQCRQEGGLDRFREFVKVAPEIGEISDLDGKQPGEGGKALNSEEAKVCDNLGISEEEYLKAK